MENINLYKQGIIMITMKKLSEVLKGAGRVASRVYDGAKSLGTVAILGGAAMLYGCGGGGSGGKEFSHP